MAEWVGSSIVTAVAWVRSLTLEDCLLQPWPKIKKKKKKESTTAQLPTHLPLKAVCSLTSSVRPLQACLIYSGSIL